MKVAIVYDRVNKWGGAERVLLALHELFPDASLFTSVYSQRGAPWANVFKDIKTSFMQRVSFFREKHELLASLMPIAFESLDFKKYDLVISVTSEAAKGIITGPNTLHICYCLTPTRYLWSGYNDYFKGSAFKAISKPVVSYLRRWDKIAAQRPDIMIAISTCVQERIRKYYGRSSNVIFPPVDIVKFQICNSKFPKVSKNKFFLIVSRLVPYKKVDLAVKTFNKLDLPLIVVGTGSEEKKLRSMARKNVKLVGHLTDNDLARYYRYCTALVMPQEEDFGIVAVEAQAAGKPVIAYGKGGSLDTIIDGKTGVLFYKQEETSLEKAVKHFLKIKFNQADLINNAKRFRKETFKKEFMNLINKL